MIEDVLDVSGSLTRLMRDESAALLEQGRCAEHAQIVAAKRRLSGQLDGEIARLNRVMPDWLQQLGDDAGAALRSAIADLREAAAANARIVERQLSLSNEMIAAVADEARRLSGNQGFSYQETGTMMHRDGTSPISVNTRL